MRHQTGSVGEAFARHEENQQSPNKVKQWAALREVADLAGMVLQNQANRYESKFVEQIVKVVDEKVSHMHTPFIVASYPIGIDSRVKYINSWLNDGSADDGIILVNGIGGIGKTTIVKFVYNLDLENLKEVVSLKMSEKLQDNPMV